MSIAHLKLSELVLTWNVHEVSEIVDVYMSEEIGMFYILRNWNVSDMYRA